MSDLQGRRLFLRAAAAAGAAWAAASLGQIEDALAPWIAGRAVVGRFAARSKPAVHERLDRRQHLFGVERGQPADRMKRPLARFTQEDAIEHEGMEVHIQVQCAPEPLNDDDATAAAVLDAAVARPIAQDTEDAPHQHAGNGTAQVVIPREAVPQPVIGVRCLRRGSYVSSERPFIRTIGDGGAGASV